VSVANNGRGSAEPWRGPLLDPVALSKLQNLELRARAVVEGALAGLHRSPHHGASVEFAEHKEYSAGDEIKHIDWKAYGKFDKYYVKRFEEETELRAYLVVDVSASMGYRGGGVSKLEYARMLAASLAYLLLKQQDQVGLIAFGERLRGYVPPRARSGHLSDLVGALEGVDAAGRTDLGRAMTYVSEVVHRRSLIVLISDLLQFGDPGVDDRQRDPRHLLRGLRARQHDVVVFHVLDRDELTLPFEGTTVFESLEDEQRALVEPADVRRAYLEEVQRFVEGYRRGLADGDVEYHLVDTARAPSEVLLQFLDGPWRNQGRK
jgi:uncharacterized protein (DUF58 family)